MIGPDAALMIDFNQACTPRYALAAAARMHEANPLWIEEPTSPGDLEGYKLVASRLAPAIAGGEALFTAKDFVPFLEAGALDVLQPDIALCGGFTGVGQVATLAELYDRPLVPHVWGSIVNFQAALHLVATLPLHCMGAPEVFPYQEFDVGPNPLLELAGRPSVNRDGTLTVPDAPGLGINLTGDILAPFITEHAVLEL
jgi:D-galactarolactone cycloisomerase